MGCNMEDKNCVLVLHDVYTKEVNLVRNDNYSIESSKLDFKLGCEHEEGLNNKFKITIKLNIEDISNEGLSLIVGVCGIFELKKGSNKNNILMNATAILFPYVRSFITTITAQSGIEPLILPAINFAELLKNRES